MRTTIRYSTFETNSSSQHAFAFIDADAYDKWVNDGYYIDLRAITESDYTGSFVPEDSYIDVSGHMIAPESIEFVRADLPEESYYEHPDDCLLEAGIFPYSAVGDEGEGTPSEEWARRCGGLLALRVSEYRDGYNIFANWYAW